MIKHFNHNLQVKKAAENRKDPSCDITVNVQGSIWNGGCQESLHTPLELPGYRTLPPRSCIDLKKKKKKLTNSVKPDNVCFVSAKKLNETKYYCYKENGSGCVH